MPDAHVEPNTYDRGDGVPYSERGSRSYHTEALTEQPRTPQPQPNHASVTQLISVATVLGAIITITTFFMKIIRPAIEWRKKETERQNRLESDLTDLNETVKAALKIWMVRDCEEIIEQGYITPTQHRIIASLYDAYTGVGGNGEITAKYKTAIRSPIRKPQPHRAKGTRETKGEQDGQN